MPTFKDLAYSILQEAKQPLHYKELTKRALKKGLVTEGKSPAATMNAVLIVDINNKKEKSRFLKVGPGTFNINPKQNSHNAYDKSEKQTLISKNVSPKQKGDIAEARIAELITLYGDTELSCYRPISDDEGIDLIVKEKGSLKSMFFQIKSRFTPDVSKVYTATVKKNGICNKFNMGLIFCDFDTSTGDLRDYLRYIPAPEFIKLANNLKDSYGFVAGRNRNDENKWDRFLIEKRQLSTNIIDQMQKIT